MPHLSRILHHRILLMALIAPAVAIADDSITLPASLAPSLLMMNGSGEYDRWQGIGRLESHGNSNCTAVLIDTRADHSAPQAPAYVLTSGHCAYKQWQSDLVQSPQAMRGHIEFNFFRDTGTARKVHQLKQLHWSSLRGRDLAIIELQAPLQQLIDEGITPLALAPAPPEVGTELLSVSAPLTANGYTLRVSSCPMDGLRDVVEHPYVWRDNLSNACTDVLPGSSGSPLLDRQDGRIVGIMGTTTRGATPETRCSTDSPCEVKDGQIEWHPATNYATRVDRLSACFTAGNLDINLEYCDLQGATAITHRNPHYQPRMASHTPEAATWNLPLNLGSSHYYTKAVRDAMACEDSKGYSSAHASEPGTELNTSIDTATGMHMLCVLGIDHPAEHLSSAALKNVYISAREVIDQPVQTSAEPAITLLPDGRYNVQLVNKEPGSVRHLFKFGAPEATDCNDARGYKHHSYNFNISSRLLPVTLCTIGFDAADRPSQPRSDLLQAPDA